MKTTIFSVAALYGLAAAQNYQFNPWGPDPGRQQPPAPPTPEPEPEDTRPEDCKTKTDELKTQLTGEMGIEAECDTQATSLAMLQAMLTAQSTTINPLVQDVNSNQSQIAFFTENNT